MSEHQTYYQKKTCRLRMTNNPRNLLELLTCAWARRRRIWCEKRSHIIVSEIDIIKQSYSHPISSTNKMEKRNNKMMSKKFCKYDLHRLSLIVMISSMLTVSSHCHYQETNETAHHMKRQRNSNLIHLSPLEGQFLLIV